MRYGSVCSGIEAASVAWHPLGWKAAWLSEIEAFPSAVLAHHYPDVPNLGDMTKFQEWPDEPIDLLVGGTPCQSFSIAGLRAGLADPRGNLLLTYLAIAARYRPRWVVWENVPGVLSSASHDAPDPLPPPDPVDMELDGQEVDVADEYDSVETHAFGSLLAGLSELGYGFAYRVLDAQFCRAHGLEYAVPQRRRRVFVVGCLGNWAAAAAVFLDGQSLRGDSPPRREAGKGIAPTLAARTRGGGGLGTDFDIDGGLTAVEQFTSHDPSVTLTARDRKGPLAIPFDTTQITSKANYSQPQAGDPSHPLAASAHPPAVAFDMRGRDGGAQFEGPHETANIRAASGGASRSYVAESWAVRRLTPVECCRLQGFPDDYLSQVQYRGKPPADGPMYKALGNSMAVNVMRVIGERIAMVEACL